MNRSGPLVLRIVCAAPLLLACAASVPRDPAPETSPGTALVVFITVDQLIPEYYERWSSQLTGGLGRLYREGAVYQNGYQDHAITETAPGHASTLSGRFPVHTGIASNSAGVADPNFPVIGMPNQPGASPMRFVGTTLADWMLARDPRTRILSVSRKDRGAILPIGRSKQQVYWYLPDGTFGTSTYYATELPAWVQRFNAQRRWQRFIGKNWTPLLAESAYTEADSVPVENNGTRFTFPHWLSASPDTATRLLANFPWVDELTLDLALEGVNRLGLGAGGRTDLLAVSLSATDAIGHTFGPDSKEIHDHIIRLDRMLGSFLDSLFTLRGRERVIVALTSDHGVAPFIDVSGRLKNPAATFVPIAPLIVRARAGIHAAGGDPAAFAFGSGALDVDRAAIRVTGMNVDSLIAAFGDSARNLPGVLRVDRINDLVRAGPGGDYITRRWLHQFANENDVPLVITMTPYSYWRGIAYATHGTPHDYDARVPIIFFGAPFRPRMNPATARVVDMAPTLARVLGLTPSQRLDGTVLEGALR